MTLKVPLRAEPGIGFHNYACGPRAQPVKRMAPFVVVSSWHGVRAHRPRSALLHINTLRGESWVSVRYWCGSGGFLRRNSVASDRLPEGAFVCGGCEGRAIGAGAQPSSVIVLRPLIFTPRSRNEAAT